MKWLVFFLGVALLVICSRQFKEKREANAKIDSLNVAYNDLICNIKELERVNDSLLIRVAIRDTIIQEKIKLLPYEVNRIYNLNADSSLRLFSRWAGHLSDSISRAGFIRIGSDSLH